MKTCVALGWLSVGLLGLIYHLGPGVEGKALDKTARFVRAGQHAVQQQDWEQALFHFDQALAALPDQRTAESRSIRLEKAKAQMLAAQLPEARESLQGLLAELLADDPGNRDMILDARSALASSQYYMTWLMRLEGLPKDEWELEIEASRQNYRLLAEEARHLGKGRVAQTASEDLEASIRLARLDLSELQALPLPSQ